MRDARHGRLWSNSWLSITAFGVALVAVSAAQIVPKRIVWNASPSVPTGLYWITNGTPMRGNVVLVELPEPYKAIADQRGYLPKNLPALKRVRALSGDQVCRFGRTIFVNDEAVSVAQLHDIRGLKLSEWSGCRTLKPDEVFLLNDHPKSFDGRYFGQVDRSTITGIADPLWTD
ncbi:S26 family signal peptidase [Salaquimonas pukyongi]|uniref:S26 family signal peptidase n=1 Tax=Salaquimonas pukyongi TaxID=2712698 RepID=UPI00096B85D2|nr:S26 family signal peptidase [Salaquimonas pukyongi]